jgi:hypothetical protein
LEANAMTTMRSRVPDIQQMDPAHYEFLDGVDKRQQRLAAVTALTNTATTQEIIDAVNAIIASHQTR